MAYADNTPDYGYGGGSFFDPMQRQSTLQMGQGDQGGPGMPSFLNAFQGGMQKRKPGQNMLMSGLAGQAGAGGARGAIGNVAQFLL